jgi:hypothetical protein
MWSIDINGCVINCKPFPSIDSSMHVTNWHVGQNKYSESSFSLPCRSCHVTFAPCPKSMSTTLIFDAWHAYISAVRPSTSLAFISALCDSNKLTISPAISKKNVNQQTFLVRILRKHVIFQIFVAEVSKIYRILLMILCLTGSEFHKSFSHGVKLRVHQNLGKNAKSW